MDFHAVHVVLTILPKLVALVQERAVLGVATNVEKFSRGEFRWTEKNYTKKEWQSMIRGDF